MLVTRETDYAMRAVLYLAKGDGKVSSIAEISGAVKISKAFLAKIAQRLIKSGILESTRGVNGGLRLAKAPALITLLDILEAIQGATNINMCVAGNKACGLSPLCSVHTVWVDLRKEVETRLRDKTIYDLL